jgi:sigma-B regulation protein RsbU (phosphoserine phosphatase)
VTSSDLPSSIYDRAPCGFLSTDPDGTVLWANETLLRWTGWTREELVGARTFASLLAPGGRIYHETHYAPMLAMQGEAHEIAFDMVRRDGTRFPVLVNSVLERRGDAPIAIHTAVFDATERREYERELLRQKERAEASEARAQALALTLQQTLIPPAPPEIPGLDLDAVYRPAGAGDQVGGDFYDVFEIARDDWVLVVGDVCGKGPAAAVVTAAARHTIRAAAVRHPDTPDVLAVLNEELLHHESQRFCTLVVVRMRRASGRWSAAVTAAGHPLPLLVRPGEEPVEVGRHGSAVGLVRDPTFHVVEAPLGPDDALVMFTDGVLEARRDDDFYGDARLVEAVRRHAGTATSMCSGVLDEVLTFQRDQPRDDIVVMSVRSTSG